MGQKGNNGTYTKTSLLRSRLVPYWYFNSRFFRRDSVSRVLFSEDTKWNLPVIIKPEGNFCLSIHIVAITRQRYVNFHMGIKFRDDLFSRISIFAIFYNRGEREIKEPRN